MQLNPDFLGAEEAQSHTVAGWIKFIGRGFGVGLLDASDDSRPGVTRHTVEIEAKGCAVDRMRPRHGGTGYSLYVADLSENIIEL
jgi:hypothetical protein